MSLQTFNKLYLTAQAANLGISKNSQMFYTHGAIICKSGKKVCEGYNHKRSYSNGTLCCSFHAEMDAINRWKSLFLKGVNKKCFLRDTKKSEEV